MPEEKSVIIIGGGGTGAALAHDLSLRGLNVTLIERGELTSGTTGRHHGLLHSGGRYAVKDQESAIECIKENIILRKIAPGSFEENDGLFIAISDEDAEYASNFLNGCEECGIPTTELTPEKALKLEPNLNPNLKLAVQVPDATFDAYRLPLRFFATAKHNGATILPFHELEDLIIENNTVIGCLVRDHTTEQELELNADIIINATGPWADKVANMANIHVPITPSPGVMVAVEDRLCNMVINRMTISGDGDIIVPQRKFSIIGTSSWVVEDPDDLGLPQSHIDKMFEEGRKLIPKIDKSSFKAAWSAARPLIGEHPHNSGRELPRTFSVFDHENDGLDGFVTIAGGKATTMRLMAEKCADLVIEKLGLDIKCQTKDYELLPHNAYFTRSG